jgi:Fe-S cluster assembly protein SufD
MIHDRQEHINLYLKNFETFEKSLNGDASSEFHAIRKEAIGRFAEIGFPTTKHEEWKYTDLSRLVETPFVPAPINGAERVSSADIDRLLPRVEGNRLVFVNGHFSPALSQMSQAEKGVWVGSLRTALRQNPAFPTQHLARYARFTDNPFTALSTAFLWDGAYIAIPEKVALSNPIYLVFLSEGAGSKFVSFPRNLIIVGREAQAAVVEIYAGLRDNTYFTNAVTEVVLGVNALLEHEKIQLESDQAFHVSAIHVQQSRDSSYVSNNISLGGLLVRNNISAVLGGEGGEATLNGLYLGTRDHLIDNHTVVEHAEPHCDSHEMYKGILDGRSKGVFNGKIIVRKDAQKTDAKQTNKNLVLSDDATIDTKPQLEIYANDVKCTHGATIGQLDDEALFYLRSRGIDMAKARDMLLYAFASDVIDRIRIESMREWLQMKLHDLLEESRKMKEAG